MRSDNEIRLDIEHEFRWDPELRDDDLAVGVKNGIATLGGVAKSYGGRWTAERVASRVKGVKAVANEIEVKLPSASDRSDPDIARAVVNALQWHTSIPDDRLAVRVENGWVTLEGEVDWYFQKEAAEHAVRHLIGVKGMWNLITVTPRPTSPEVKDQIKRALERNAAFDADRITVQVRGNKAILSGSVGTLSEKGIAERAARNAPGVLAVENELTVRSDTFAVA